MSNIGIYKITSPTNKVYIGQSWNLEKRRDDYRWKKCKKQPKLFNSINKYGWDAHKFEVVINVSENLPQLMFDNIEQAYMDYYRSTGCELLNTREAGSSGKHSKETKRRMSEAKKGTVFTEEHRKNLSESHKGKMTGENNPYYGKPLHENCRKKQAEWMKGYTPTEETRVKISDAQKLVWSDPEYHTKMSEKRRGEKNPFYGKKLSPEHIEKLRISHLGQRAWNKGKETPQDVKNKIGNANRKPNKKSRVVNQYDMDGNFIKGWEYGELAGRELNIQTSHISECCNSKRKSAGGYIWRYKNEK